MNAILVIASGSIAWEMPIDEENKQRARDMDNRSRYSGTQTKLGNLSLGRM